LKTFSFEVIKVNRQGQIIHQKTRSAQFFEADLGTGVKLDLVAIPGGTFVMGSPDSEEGRDEGESPQHSVTIAPFYVGKFTVTQAQYQAITGDNPAQFKGENRPVENVTWEDAISFCQQLSDKTGNLYRLPSEAEWEYACRAGTTSPFYFGETIIAELANFASDNVYRAAPTGINRSQTTDVGSFPPNEFGLYDMHGNVREWCEDHRHDNYEGAPSNSWAWVDPEPGVDDRRMVRGGSWNDVPQFCRSADRHCYFPNTLAHYVGFRVVCAAIET
jgi:eukaryotic-like serine/threonine-protein kinase